MRLLLAENTIYFRLPSAAQWRWHGLRTLCTREVLRARAHRARAPRAHGLPWHSHRALHFVNVYVRRDGVAQ